MRLFLDLDGVLSDFDRGVREVTGRRPEDLPLKDMWAALARAPRFFEALAFMEDAGALWHFCQPHHPTILTGLPHGTWAPAQKRRWVARMLGAHVPVITCMTREKPGWSGAGHVLVDDRLATREGWERKGGIFIHHLSADRSIAALRRLGFTEQGPAASGPGKRLTPRTSSPSPIAVGTASAPRAGSAPADAGEYDRTLSPPGAYVRSVAPFGSQAEAECRVSKNKGQSHQGKMGRGQTSPGQPAGGRRMSDEMGHSGGAHMPETGGKDHQGEQQRTERDKAGEGKGRRT